MSQDDRRKVGSSERAEGRGCGCGGHGPHSHRAGIETTADAAVDTSEHKGEKIQDARRPAESPGCCCGGKAHR